MNIVLDKTLDKQEKLILGNYSFVKDSGNDLGRIITNFKNGGMIISAMRSEYTLEENLKRTEDLKQTLKSLNLGFRPSIGGFIENLEKNEISVEELSFIVPYNRNQMTEEKFYNIALSLCAKYGQDSVLVKLPSMFEGKAKAVNKYGEVDMNFGEKFKLAKNEEYYTKPIKHNTPAFTFPVEDGIKDEDIASYYGKWNYIRDMHSAEGRKYDKFGWRM